MKCVLDASAALALLVKSQATAASEIFEAAPPELVATAHFGLEVRQAIIKLERRKLIPVASVDGDLGALESAMEFEAAPNLARLNVILALARTEELSAYDASYVELALRSGANLASRDTSQIAAARRRGVHVFDLT